MVSCKVIQHMKRKRERLQSAFTLIELLLAMSILALLTLMMSQIFNDSVTAFRLGMRKTEQNLSGRAILDFMAEELETAVVRDNLPFVVDNYNGYQKINFAAMNTDVADPNSGPYRAVRLIKFYVRDPDSDGVDDLMRWTIIDDAKLSRIYAGKSQWVNGINDDEVGSSARVAEKITDFRVRVNGDQSAPYDYDSQVDGGLPLFVDLYLEISESAQSFKTSVSSAGPDKSFGSNDDIQSW